MLKPADKEVCQECQECQEVWEEWISVDKDPLDQLQAQMLTTSIDPNENN